MHCVNIFFLWGFDFVFHIYTNTLTNQYNNNYGYFVECPLLVPPLDGSLSTKSTFVGVVINISCNAGFTLFGDETLKCLTNGTWTSRVGDCKKGTFIDLIVGCQNFLFKAVILLNRKMEMKRKNKIRSTCR